MNKVIMGRKIKQNLAKSLKGFEHHLNNGDRRVWLPASGAFVDGLIAMAWHRFHGRHFEGRLNDGLRRP